MSSDHLPEQPPVPESIARLGAWERPSDMPDALAAEVAGWRFVLRSPGENAFYSKPGTPWRTPQDGTLRVAARWAEDGDGRSAPATDRPVPEGHWAVARFEGGVWRVESDTPALGRAAARDLVQARADRLTAGRRWARGDLDLLQALVEVEAVGREALIAGNEGRVRSLRSLLTLHLASEAAEEPAELPAPARRILEEGTGPAVWMDADAKAVAAAILDWQAKRQVRAIARADRGAARRGQADDLKSDIAEAARGVFPRMPAEVAAAAAARLAPSVAKLGRRPGMQAIVDAVVEIRIDRWRQAIASDPAVATRLEQMQQRGDPGRARKRYRDQRALERVEAEVKEWRGDLGPVTSRLLG
ncbi:hypothetical protein [Azospirillum sp. SYSU D00513]|uniref:hypothetical protein n=1 Tax=Azospirillum sp. SYSU D00513 TaxID=2812561 RepID=UPI001FFE4AF9|nr:hypothetical protein [Azospirillum sp. SYSU D00513]